MNGRVEFLTIRMYILEAYGPFFGDDLHMKKYRTTRLRIQCFHVFILEWNVPAHIYHD